jgi:cytochrome c554/c'-like protein
MKAIALIATVWLAILGGRIAAGAQMATADRVRAPGWWPTKGSVPRADYVGAAECRSCHGAHAASQPTTAMARTASKAEGSDILRTHDRLTFKNGDYSYEIVSNGGRPLYAVTNGTQSASFPLTWAFGVGNVGQSFLFERDGAFQEARVSYFDLTRALDFTPARAVTSPRDLDEAMARRVGDAEARRCFGCHTTASTADGTFDPSRATPGVTCEACHGPGRAHVAAMKQPRTEDRSTAILNPAKLRPEESVDFCGACHATFFDIALSGDRGIPAMRSQPYRLRSSRCWTAADARLTCIACHNPHRPLVKDARSYDTRCLSCHVTADVSPTADRPGRSCPVRTSDCVSCHMPKFDVPDMHHEFTDHLIARPLRAP